MSPQKTSAARPAVELAKQAVAFERAFSVYFPGPAKDMAELATQYLLGEGVRFWIGPRDSSITCVKCRMTSSHREDIKQRYCGNCHEFLDEDAA